MSELIKRFDSDMVNIYIEANKLRYNASYFWQMISDMGGYQAAKLLINTDKPSEGFTKLWELRRLDLSVEAHVLKPEYTELFSEEERQKCRDRLTDYGYLV